MFEFYKSKSNFARFKKKMTSMAYVLPKSQTLKNVARYLSKKVPFEVTHRQASRWTGRNTDSISTTAPIPYLLITGKVIELEKATRSDMQRLKVFF